MLNVAYAGSHSVHLPAGGFSYNVIPPNLLTTCQNQHIAGCVPYPTLQCRRAQPERLAGFKYLPLVADHGDETYVQWFELPDGLHMEQEY